MKICQIATVGRNPEWIQLGLFRYPTSLLVLITTEDYLEQANEITELVKGIEVRIEIIEKPRDSYYIVDFLKNLINDLHSKEYELMLNVTSGLVSWQLLFYSTATILKEKIKSFYIIDKERKEPMEMVLYQKLSKTEERVLLLIPEEGVKLEAITTKYKELQEDKKGSSGLLSRYLKQLTAEGLVTSRGSTKNKLFLLTEKGKLVKNALS